MLHYLAIILPGDVRMSNCVPQRAGASRAAHAVPAVLVCWLSAEHVASSRQVDEAVWTELRNFKKCLIQMFMQQVGRPGVSGGHGPASYRGGSVAAGRCCTAALVMRRGA